jgi:hypothetical protein
VPGYANVRAMAKLAFGKDLSRNGAVSAITLDRTGGRP